MAGSLPGIPLSQQFDSNGNPLRGALLYIYQANTTTPQAAFSDSGLTLSLGAVLEADATGRLPMFYLADGSVHVRLTDSGGVVQFDYPSMLVIGPSSGGGGGGGVDPTTIFQTGDCVWFEASGPRTGWVRDNGRTIGNATSGASERANADVSALYVYLWNTYSQPSGNTVCPVSGGLGANGLADFNAGKQLTLPDKRGYSPKGDTAMGNADSARLASVPFSQGNSTTSGSLGGEARHTLILTEAPTGQFTFNFNDPGHPHTIGTGGSTGGSAGFASTPVRVSSGSTDSSTTGITASITDHAGGGAHNNEGLFVIGTYYRKL